ncbi:hypothetical protein K474DRAFT_1711911 [Panus rudis PR-1116 ss-1]|nr:hypothetical protein K474DRAFT_1711911 [Panus rudis PR-1116 ss-1]
MAHESSSQDSRSIASLLDDAVHQENPSLALTILNRTILASAEPEDLDPLSTISTVLTSGKEGAEDVLRTIGSRCSPREAILAIQEEAEKLYHRLESEEVKDGLDGDGEDSAVSISPATQVARLLMLYELALPRLAKRKKSSAAILSPLISQIARLIDQLRRTTPKQSARIIIPSVASMIQVLRLWIDEERYEGSSSADMLYDLARNTVEIFPNAATEGLLEQSFSRNFPRLVVPARRGEASDRPESVAMNLLMDAIAAIGIKDSQEISRPSIASIVLLARRPGYVMDIPTLKAFSNVLIFCIQTNTAIEGTLSILLDTLAKLKSLDPPPELPEEVLVPLVHSLAPLASVHPDPSVRHSTFRILALALALAPSIWRLSLLTELVSEDEESMPQMRVAAVGLVKEAVLEALQTAPGSSAAQSNVFVSPLFMRQLGSQLFLHLPESISTTVRLKKFLESAEPSRLVEVLGLLFVLLKRDVDNRTGIADYSLLRQIVRQVLQPLQSRLQEWKIEMDADPGLQYARFRVEIVEMWVERVFSAIQDIIPDNI